MTEERILSDLSEFSDDTFTNVELGQRTPPEVGGSESLPEELTNSDEAAIVQEETEINDSIQENNETKEKTESKSNEPKLNQLPLSRIKNLMKLESDLHIASAEAVFLVAKATELFIDSLAKEAFLHTAQAKKKTIQKRDVEMAIASVDSLMFLDGALNF